MIWLLIAVVLCVWLTASLCGQPNATDQYRAYYRSKKRLEEMIKKYGGNEKCAN